MQNRWIWRHIPRPLSLWSLYIIIMLQTPLYGIPIPEVANYSTLLFSSFGIGAITILSLIKKAIKTITYLTALASLLLITLVSLMFAHHYKTSKWEQTLNLRRSESAIIGLLKDQNIDTTAPLKNSISLKDALLLHKQDTQKNLIIDIRELEERELMFLPESISVPLSRLDQHQSLLKPNIHIMMICHSGFRSALLVNDLLHSSLDKNMTFSWIKGGYIEWLKTTNSTLPGGPKATLKDVLPPFPNSKTYLTTKDVLKLQKKVGAILVDTRPSLYFDPHQIEQVVHIPIQEISPYKTPVFEDAIQPILKLNRPIIGLAYGFRSAFDSTLLGLRLHRLGIPYLGTYTTPESYPDKTRLTLIPVTTKLQSLNAAFQKYKNLSLLSILGLFIIGSLLWITYRKKTTPLSTKAARLKILRRQGVQVPPFIIWTPKTIPLTRLTQIQLTLFNYLYRIKTLAIRSSAYTEDTSQKSMAGQFYSELGVTMQTLQDALTKTRKSMESKGQIIIQKEIIPDYAGVLFTQWPMDPTKSLVEVSKTSLSKFTQGHSDANQYWYQAYSQTPLTTTAPPIPLEKLITIGHQIASLFGKAQDIEWAYANNTFHILQTRDITPPYQLDPHKKQCLTHITTHPSLPLRTPFFTKNELVEETPSLPPLSQSLLEAIWGFKGPFHNACNQLGLRYTIHAHSSPLFYAIEGQLFCSTFEYNNRFKSLPKAKKQPHHLLETTLQSYLRNDLPRCRSHHDLITKTNLADLELSTLWSLWDTTLSQFLRNDYTPIMIINLCISQQASSTSTKNGRPSLQLPTPPLTWAHRAIGDLDLSLPRFLELEESSETIDTWKTHYEKMVATPLTQAIESNNLDTLKEIVKHHSVYPLATLRHLIKEIDKRLQLNGSITMFTLDELCVNRTKLYPRTISEPTTHKLGVTLSLNQFETLDSHITKLPTITKTTMPLQGLCVAGYQTVEGAIFQLNQTTPLTDIQHTDIVVATSLSPQDIMALPDCKGIVTEVGAYLSHTAILAREQGITMITNVPGAKDNLPHGQKAILALDGSIRLA